MSDMSHVYKAYAAVHNSEKRNDLSEVRDEISEMNLKQLTDVDLYEVAEEVLEDVFAGGADIADAKKLIESVFTKASEGDANPFREDKIDRLAEAFISAFEKVTERSLRTAVESYSEYRINKERLEKWNDSNSTGNVNAKLHEKLVAQDRLIVKNGLKSMIESIGSAIDKTLGAAGEVADTAIKLPAKGVGYLKGLKKGLKKAAKGAETKAAGDASPKNEETILEKQKDTPDQVAAVIDMYRSKKGTGEAVKDTEEGKTEAAKKERDYAAWERSKMKKDDPDWKHKKGSTTESVEADKYIETVQKVKAAETEEDIKRWKALEESGNFTAEEIETIKEADIADILARLEKKRISKGGDPEESPLPAMRKYHADKKKKAKK